MAVILHHVANRRTNIEAYQWLHGLDLIFDWCVFAFFLVAGYLQALSDSMRLKSFTEFAVVRLRRLLLPFVLLIFAYAVIWQILQAASLTGHDNRLPTSFVLKVVQSLWPVTFSVAEQLYYFPLLLGVSLVVILARTIAGVPAISLVSSIAFIVGIYWFPLSATGFHLSIFCWGIFYYGFGYLLFLVRENAGIRRMLVVVLTLILLVTCGGFGAIKAVPLWLLAEASLLGLARVPLLDRLGKASGTIYAYHSPFVIQPMAIGLTLLHGAIIQFVAALAAVALTAFICCALYENLKETRAKVLLI